MKNKKGFVFIESVIVTVIIFIASIPTYVLTKNVATTFEKRATYDAADHLYDLNAIKVFLYRNYDVNNLCNYIDDTTGTYNKNNEAMVILYQNKNYVFPNFLNDEDKKSTFVSLMNNMKIKKLFFTNYDINLDNTGSTISKVNKDTNLRKYIEYLQKDKKGNTYLYRLVAEFEDGEFASINMYRLGK